MFPLIGLAPAALVRFLKRRDDDPKAQAQLFLVMWFALSFALFSLMLTKFHHYILPAVPAAAMLIGIYLDELLPARLFKPLPDAEEKKEERENEPEPARQRSIEKRVISIAGVVLGT